PLSAEEPTATPDLIVNLTWSDGSPAADVAFDVRCENDPAPRDEHFRARTDEAGRAQLAGLFAGPVRVHLDRGFRYDAEVEAGATRSVTFTIPEGLDVEGRVV